MATNSFSQISNALQTSKNNLSKNLNDKSISASSSESLNTLISKIKNIKIGYTQQEIMTNNPIKAEYVSKWHYSYTDIYLSIGGTDVLYNPNTSEISWQLAGNSDRRNSIVLNTIGSNLTVLNSMSYDTTNCIKSKNTNVEMQIKDTSFTYGYGTVYKLNECNRIYVSQNSDNTTYCSLGYLSLRYKDIKTFIFPNDDILVMNFDVQTRDEDRFEINNLFMTALLFI